jgi:uncharacterized membrane protein
MTMLTMDMPERSSRWLLIGSLALNLFFIGTIGALAVRHTFAPAQPAAPERSRTAAARIERLAAPLPPADAEKLRAAYAARASAAEAARDALTRAFERMQATLRAQPFNADDLRAAMAEIRAVRPAYEQVMQEILAAGAAAMSNEGRAKLAEWPPRPAPTANKR